MPLFARAFTTHYPDREGSPRLDHHIVLSGGLEVGGFYLVGGGPSEGHWSWGATLASGNAEFIAGGYASRGEVCRTLIAVAFRRMLLKADLRERPDAMPGPPRRAHREEIAAEPLQVAVSDGPDADRLRGRMLGNKLSKSIRSGELDVGVLSRATHGAENWSWFLTGLHRPDDPNFIWRGEAETEDEAFDALAACWSRWVEWAGLEMIEPLQRGVTRP